MSHTEETRRRAYKKQRAIRAAWFKKNGPCKGCGSWEELELDHIDPKTKISHCVWSWNRIRREQELKKCQSLCNSCHKKKTYKEQSKGHGQSSYNKGCRCTVCKKAHAEYRANRRKYLARNSA